MQFSLSVHNAVCGILSIAWKLEEMQSVIAAGCDSFAMGITETLSLLNAYPKRDVLFIYVDYPLPDVFAAFNEPAMQAEARALLFSQTSKNDNGICLEMSINDQYAKEGANLLNALEAVLIGTQRKMQLGSDAFGWEGCDLFSQIPGFVEQAFGFRDMADKAPVLCLHGVQRATG